MRSHAACVGIKQIVKTKTDQGVSFNVLISNRRLGCTALDKGFLCVLKLKLGLNFSEKRM